MTITQLEYIIAVSDCNSFAKAAKKCNITQPTLSMQIKKLETELNLLLFDRSKKPVRPTEIGIQIIEQARVSLGEISRIQYLIESKEDDCSGEIRLGIIPTLSPYLMPLFAVQFVERYPNITLTVKEMLSEDILYKLYNNHLDLGILVAPTSSSALQQIPLFYEPFVAFLSPNHSLSVHSEIDFNNLDLSDMWLLKEGHCFRNQIISICGENPMKENKNRLRFESGSLETLRRIVEKQSGYTLLPELATLDMSPIQKGLVREFSKPKPLREISLVINRSFAKRRIIKSLQRIILENIPPHLKQKRDGTVIDSK